MIYRNITECIGHTPLVALSRFAPEAQIFAKLEKQNPGGSAKDRPALEMIRAAEADGSLKPGGTIVEETSGNTGLGLAMCGAALGYHVVVVMPDNMSVERIKLAKAYGAEVVLTPGAQGMSGAIEKAEEILKNTPGAIMAGQFVNPANPEAHYKTTGPEIWADCGGELDVLLATVGTGGTLTGAARYLREKKPDLYVVAAEPAGSPVLSGGKPGPHALQGIGAGFVPDVLDTGIYDEVVTVTDEEAFSAMRDLARKEGILCGISSGAAAAAARKIAEKMPGRRIVAILPDTGERYLSVL